MKPTLRPRPRLLLSVASCSPRAPTHPDAAILHDVQNLTPHCSSFCTTCRFSVVVVHPPPTLPSHASFPVPRVIP